MVELCRSVLRVRHPYPSSRHRRRRFRHLPEYRTLYCRRHWLLALSRKEDSFRLPDAQSPRMLEEPHSPEGDRILQNVANV